MMAKMQELTKERDSKATEVLSKEQQEKYEKMKGKPFDVAPLMQFGARWRPRWARRSLVAAPVAAQAAATGRPQKKAEEYSRMPHATARALLTLSERPVFKSGMRHVDKESDKNHAKAPRRKELNSPSFFQNGGVAVMRLIFVPLRLCAFA